MKINRKDKYSVDWYRLVAVLLVCIALIPAIYAGEPKDIERDLPELVVKPKKQKYTKRNNPAVDLMERIRSTSWQTDPELQPWYMHDNYERITVGVNDFDVPDSAMNTGAYAVLKDYVDSLDLTGARVLNLSERERVWTTVNRSEPKSHKEIVKGRRSGGIDQAFNQENINLFLNDVLRPIDIYSNDITLMQNRFVSPLSRIGADFYMYFITDTVSIDSERCVELTFAPKNPQSMSFNGKIYVTADAKTPFVKQVNMRVPAAINVNYLKNLYVRQTFVQDSIGMRHKTADRLVAEFQILPGTPELFASRDIYSTGFSYNPDADTRAYADKDGEEIDISAINTDNDEYWSGVRATYGTPGLAAVTMIDRLRALTWFRWTEKVLTILVNGYVKTGNPSKVDLGPVNTLFSVNSAEGARFRVGGMTTAHLSPRWFGRGYLAYGTKDRRLKYGAEVEYSFVDKKYHSREYPMNAIRLEHSYDLDMIGQHYLFTNADNVFLSWKRRPSTLVTYRRMTRLQYILEKASGFSLNIGLRHEIQQPSKWLPFVDGNGNVMRNYTQAAFFVQFRYAPGEKFVQSASMRLPVNLDAPVIMLTQEYAPRKFLGADFTTNKTELSAMKRFWFSAFGYTDVIVKASKMWSSVYYPALSWQNANLTYTIQPESYALLNPMEFALDQYVSWDVTYWGNGVLFNRIPLVNKLKMREVVAFRGFYGSLTDANKPWLHRDMPVFPEDANVGMMGHKPYMEISIGLDNILTFIRLDYVWRLSYRDTPGVDRSGLRFALHFTF